MHNIDLTEHIDDVYRAVRGAQKTPGRSAFAKWQSEKRRVLKRLLAVPALRVLKVKRVRGMKVKFGAVTIFDFYMSDGTIMPVWVGTPAKGTQPYPPVLVYHGHADGAQTVFGFGMTNAHQDYALEYMRRGYMVVAPDQRGFGKRLGPSSISYKGYTRSCRQLSFDLMLCGKTLLGERLGDVMALLRYVKKMPGVARDRIIVTGNSGGGTLALLHAALDDQVHAAVVGSSFCEYRHSIMAISHCECNYVPGLLNHFKEIDEVAALAAPKPLMIVHGAKDPIFPVRFTRSAFKRLKALYGPHGRVRLAVHSGGHRYDHAGVFAFLDSLR